MSSFGFERRYSAPTISCSNCHNNIHELFSTDSCLHILCHQCILNSKDEYGKKTCPHCGRTFSKTIPIKYDFNEEHIIDCPYKDAECNWRGRLESLQKHLEDHKCPYKEDDFIGSEYELAQHVLTKHGCPYQQEDSCFWTGSKSDVKDHLSIAHSCTNKKYGCPKIASKMELKKHYKTCEYGATIP